MYHSRTGDPLAKRPHFACPGVNLKAKACSAASQYHSVTDQALEMQTLESALEGYMILSSLTILKSSHVPKDHHKCRQWY